MLFLDLDDFKTVNDSLGHPVGDRLLVEVAERLVGCVRPGDTVARLGGDEFAILLEGSTEGAPGAGVAGRMMQALRAPFSLAGKGVFVRSSVGIARSTGAERAEDLLRNADVAMYTAKTRGKGRYEFYEPGMHSEIVQRLELRADLRRAIERREFVVYYQPIVSLAGERRAREVEALARWLHPERGLIPPGEFIPLAEETGDIVEIGDLVLESACRQARAWQDPDGQPLVLSVNLSARQFARPDLPEAISAILRKTAFDPRDLKLEITESVAMGDVGSALSTLERLKDLGVQVAIDDFGTGYSSLSYLSRFPVDTLKIDRSFVGRLEEDPECAAIVSATVDLARNLGLEVIAEGVETAAQLDLISRLGCDFAQGFYLSEPVPPEEIGSLLSPLF